MITDADEGTLSSSSPILTPSPQLVHVAKEPQAPYSCASFDAFMLASIPKIVFYPDMTDAMNIDPPFRRVALPRPPLPEVDVHDFYTCTHNEPLFARAHDLTASRRQRRNRLPNKRDGVLNKKEQAALRALQNFVDSLSSQDLKKSIVKNTALESFFKKQGWPWKQGWLYQAAITRRRTAKRVSIRLL